MNGNGGGNCQITNADSGGVTQISAKLSTAGGDLSALNRIAAASAATGSVVCAVAANGRGVLASSQSSTAGGSTDNSNSRIFYLASPGRGFFLNTNYAALGKIEPQVSEFVNLSSFTGSYTYSSPANTSSTGTNRVDSDGRGRATLLLDSTASNGVGSSTGTTTTSYTVTDAAAGRFALLSGAQIFYRTSSTRFIAVNTDPQATTSVISVIQR
jgi:hypothetical protein